MDNVLHEDGSRGLHRRLSIRNGQIGVLAAVPSEMENGKDNSYGFTFKKLKLHDYLPYQYGKYGVVINGHKFLVHLIHEHRGYCPEGSLINGSPFRYLVALV